MGEGCRVDPSFQDAILENPQSRLVYTVEEYSRVFLQEAKNGDFIMFEEAGMDESGDHRKWQKVETDVLKYIMQTQRWHRLFVYFTMPDFGLFDKDARRFIRYYVEVKGYYEDYYNATLAYVFELKKDHYTGGVFPHYFTTKLRGTDGRLKEWKLSQGIIFKPPPQKVIDAYEKYSKEKKTESEAKQGKKITDKQALEEEKKKVKEEFNPMDVMLEVWDRQKSYKTPKGNWNRSLIETDFKIGRVYSNRVLALLDIHEREEIAKGQAK